jgi:hypothetical protein
LRLRFAVIAYFRDEPGAETMVALLVSAGKKDSPLLMTDVNYAEVNGPLPPFCIIFRIIELARNSSQSIDVKRLIG